MLFKKLSFIAAIMFAGFLFFNFNTDTADAASYTVKKGDTLSSIAKTYSVTVTDLKKKNNLKTTTIKVGQKLTLPVNAKKKSTAKATTTSKKYKTLRVSSTAYTAYCTGCSGRTKTGINLRANPTMKVIAVDPRVIPLGSKVWVEGYGTAVAADTGGAIKGNKIDVFMSSKKKALNWGRKNVTIKVYNS